ncbi:MAG: SUMF1/EgtB/PvdO family nonheme iron enzyme [Anaerolineae bacterium]|nr:MAG: SUMF1/EgtB/PvdO family nonheme iron enzyme [Anaerolineae bacterium]
MPRARRKGDRLVRRVLRGGSWNNSADNVRCAYRNHNDPRNWNNNLGFRLVAHDLPSA